MAAGAVGGVGNFAQTIAPFPGLRSLAHSHVSFLITSHLDYCNVLYTGLPFKTTWKLPLVKNVA